MVAVDEERKIITAAEMDKMTPQERADAIDARSVRSWDEVPQEFKESVFARARELGAQLSGDD